MDIQEIERVMTNSANLKALEKWARSVDKKLDRLETVQRIEITTLFVTMGTVLIKLFS